MTTLKNIIAAAAIVGFASCQSAPSADKATATDKHQEAEVKGTSFTIDTAASTITWIGTKPTGQHTGLLSVSTGSFSVDAGNITAGTFVIDINSLRDTDLEGEAKGKLEGHLKSPDFFDAAKFPTATFSITGVEAYDSTKAKSVIAGATHIISGNLKLKDSTKNISFPAKVDVQGDAINATADFNIDRTQWGMYYNSDASIQDKFIRHEVNLKLNIKAKK